MIASSRAAAARVCVGSRGAWGASHTPAVRQPVHSHRPTVWQWNHRQQAKCVMSNSGASASAGSAATAEPPMPSGTALWQSITERYDRAQRDAAATITETNTEAVEEAGVRFVLRVASRLRDKPKPPANSTGEKAKKEWRNPFLPYEQALWVANLGVQHVLLLNKFNIVPWHCLVVTSEFRPQTDDLDAADWEATWAVMQSMPHGSLAFYNCGLCSGASQPHKHVQIVPLPLDDSSSSDSSSSSRYSDSAGIARPPIWPAVAAVANSAGEPFELRNLPFAAFAATLAPPPPAAAAGAAAATDVGAYLAGVYGQLMGHCRAFVEGKTGRQGVTPEDGSLSYNMVCTSDFMMIVPRWQEAVGPVSCNSVAFAGSIFVRSREEQQFVMDKGPLHILANTGYQW